MSKTISSSAVKLTIGAILIFLVVVPLVNMFTALTPKDVTDVLTSTRFVPALVNTVVLGMAATAISLLVAYGLALATERVEMRLKAVFAVILVLPMLIPSISHGMGLIILLGNNGIITRALGLDISIYGPLGIILGSVMYAFPPAYIILSDALRYEDRAPYAAADILGIGRMRRFLRITLPYLRRPLIAAAFSSFALITTDYGVPLMIGGTTKTVARLMFDEVIGQLRFGRGCVYGLVLLIPAVIAFAADVLNKDRAGGSLVESGKKEEGSGSSRAKKIWAYALCTTVSVIALLPIAAFLLLAFAKNYPTDMTFTLDNITKTMSTRGGGRFLLNSLVMSLLTAAIGSALCFVIAYLTARMRSKLSGALHLLTLSFMAIPGIVLGLSYVVTFSGSALAGTLVILVMVNMSHFMSSPYLMMYNRFCKMDEQLEAVGATMGIGRMRMIRDVFVPAGLGTVAEMFSYMFVNSMMTISAVSFLSTLSTRPISLMINQFESQMQYESAAVVSLVILGVNMLLKAVMGLVGNRRRGVSLKQKKTI